MKIYSSLNLMLRSLFPLCICLAMVWSEDPITVARNIDQLVASGKMATAQKSYALYAAQPESKALSVLLMFRILHLTGKTDKANEHLNSAFGSKEQRLHWEFDMQLAYADTLAALGRFDEAVAFVDQLGAVANDLEKIKSAEVMSDIFASKQRWEDAREWIVLGAGMLESIKYSDADKEHYQRLLTRRAYIEDMLDLLAHVAGFRLYRIGNEHRLKGRYADGVFVFSKLLDLHAKNKGRTIPDIKSLEDDRVDDCPIPDIYAAAAMVYRGECLFMLGK